MACKAYPCETSILYSTLLCPGCFSLSVQLPAGVPGKAVEDDAGAWVPVPTPIGDLNERWPDTILAVGSIWTLSLSATLSFK